MQDFVSLSENLKQHAQDRPNAAALTCGSTTLSYGELHRRTNRVARGLLRLGVKLGDLVTVGLPNGTDFVEACYGIWKIGATPQPVSFRLPQAELLAIVELAETPVVIAEFNHDVGRPVMSLQAIAALAAADDDDDLPDVIAPVSKAPTSGGSTGRPKLILSGDPGVVPRVTPEVGSWDLRSSSVALIPAPLYHNAGFGMMMSAIAMGAHLVLLPRFDAEATLAEIAARQVTWVYLVPTMMHRIWSLPSEVRTGYDIGSIETLWHLAAPCPPWLKEAFIHWWGPQTVKELYGGTEGHAATIISGTEWLEHRGSVGRVFTGEIAIFDDEGASLPAPDVGEIYMRRPPGSPPSYKYLGATAKSLPGGWESLGDIGWFDEDGYLYLADRRTDMVLVGGSNVYPAEIEAVLDEHPGVGSSAVIGLPDDELGARLHAIVQAVPSVEADLRKHLGDRLVTYKQPRTYEFVSEPLRDDAGKVRRSALRDARLNSGDGA